MSCFWDTLLKRIKSNDLIYLLNNDKITPINFALKLKKKNKIVKNIIINGKKITKNQQNENYNHIINYNINTINDGYYCSTFDPFLILIANIFSITINNNFDNNLIIYKPYIYSRYEIELKNNKGHMY